MVGFCFLSPRGVVVSYFLVYFNPDFKHITSSSPHVWCGVWWLGCRRAQVLTLKKQLICVANSSGW